MVSFTNAQNLEEEIKQAKEEAVRLRKLNLDLRGKYKSAASQEELNNLAEQALEARLKAIDFEIRAGALEQQKLKLVEKSELPQKLLKYDDVITPNIQKQVVWLDKTKVENWSIDKINDAWSILESPDGKMKLHISYNPKYDPKNPLSLKLIDDRYSPSIIVDSEAPRLNLFQFIDKRIRPELNR